METAKTIQRRVEETLHKLDVRSYGGYMLSWDVKITFHPSVEQTIQKIAESFYINRTELLTMFPEVDSVVAKKLTEDNLFQHVTESMWRSWEDADTYSMCSPERLKAWGLPHGMKAPGVKGPFRATYELHGRSNGHLVVTSFEGVNLNVPSSFDGDLAEFAYVGGGDKTWMRRLGAMIEEWNDILTPQKVYEEYKYTIAWMVNCELEDSVAKVA